MLVLAIAKVMLGSCHVRQKSDKGTFCCAIAPLSNRSFKWLRYQNAWMHDVMQASRDLAAQDSLLHSPQVPQKGTEEGCRTWRARS